MKTILHCSAVVLLSALACFAQTDEKKTPEELHFFHLDFVIKELESGKVINSRSYAMTVSSRSDTVQIRTGDKVAISSGNGFTYLDAGISIECRYMASYTNKLALMVNADISTIPTEGAFAEHPTIRQTRWNSALILPLGKATTMLLADAVSSKRQMQLEVTATQIQ